MGECNSHRGRFLGGHRYRIEWREGYTRTEDSPSRFVCDAVRQERYACARCGGPEPTHGNWVTTSRRGLTGYSWPKIWSVTFNAEGELWTEFGHSAIRASPPKDTPDP